MAGITSRAKKLHELYRVINSYTTESKDRLPLDTIKALLNRYPDLELPKFSSREDGICWFEWNAEEGYLTLEMDKV